METQYILIITVGLAVFITGLYLIFKKALKKKDPMIPKLHFETECSDDFCAVKLINKGEGTAVIKKVHFWRKNVSDEMTEKNSIDQIFPISKLFWMNNTCFDSERDYYIAGNESFFLGKLYKDRILSSGGIYNKIKTTFEDEIKNINIRVEYRDVFERAQPALEFKENHLNN